MIQYKKTLPQARTRSTLMKQLSNLTPSQKAIQNAIQKVVERTIQKAVEINFQKGVEN